MKTIIIANNQKSWKSWNKKIQEIKNWFSPALDLHIEIVHKNIKNIPYVEYGMFDGFMRYGIDKKWYKENILSKDHDITIFSVNRKDWDCFPVEGWQWDGNSIAIASDEKGSYNFKGVKYPGEKWFNLARHEICHALYIKQGKVDNTHKYWDTGILEQVLVELKQSKITNFVTNLVSPPKGYRYFNSSEIEGLKPELVRMLDDARHIAGIPFKLNSGFRTQEQNKKAGGVKDSSHLTGMAVDIACPSDGARWKIEDAVKKVGFKRIGIANTFVHVDIDPNKAQNVIWLYK